MKAYKIVKRIENKLFPWVFYDWGKVEYTPGQWIEAPKLAQKYGYHLTVFETFEDALRFLNEQAMMDDEIWECEIVPAARIMPAITEWLEPHDVFDDARKMYKMRHRYLGKTPEQLGWPKGTLMAKKVKLIRRVWPKDKEANDD